MPHSGTKSRDGKRSRKSASQVPSPETQDLEVDDVNPDRLTRAQWTDMLAQEDKDETVGEILEEQIRKTIEDCLKLDVQKQLIPFTASWAINYLSQSVEQRLLCLGEGEGSEEASLTEDSEPVPTIADAYAPGGGRVLAASLRKDPWVIPAQPWPEVKEKCNAVVQTCSAPNQSEKVSRPSKPLMGARKKVPGPCPSPKVDRTKKQQCSVSHREPGPPPLDDIWLIPAKTAPEIKQKCNAVVQTPSVPNQSEKEARPSKPLMGAGARNKVPGPCPSPKVDRTKKQQMKIPPRPAQGKLLPPLSHSAKQMDVKNKNSGCSVSHREPGSLHQRKGCQPIPRLDPASQPRNSILPQYEILDANYTTQKGKKQSGPSKFDQRHEKQPTEGTVTSLKPPTSSNDQSQRTKEADCRLNKLSPSSHSMEGRVSAGPLRLDKMELAKGVLRHPQAVDINSFKVKSPTLSTKLQVIQSAKSVPLYSVEEITAGPPPRVIPLLQSKRCDT